MRRWLFALVLTGCLSPIDKGRLLFNEALQAQQDTYIEFLKVDEACLKKLTAPPVTREVAESRVTAYQTKQAGFRTVRNQTEVIAREVSSLLFYSSALPQEEVDVASGKMQSQTLALRASLDEARHACR